MGLPGRGRHKERTPAPVAECSDSRGGEGPHQSPAPVAQGSSGQRSSEILILRPISQSAGAGPPITCPAMPTIDLDPTAGAFDSAELQRIPDGRYAQLRAPIRLAGEDR